MTVKKYSPIRIANPGEGHLVPLLPTQGFLVVLDGQNASVDFDSPYFSLVKTIQNPAYTIFVFEQNFDLSLWSRLSKVYLGEVIVMYSNGPTQIVGSLCVMLNSASSHKTSLVTAINPTSDVIKIEPFDIIEIVVYDEKVFGTWDWRIVSGQNSFAYHLVNSKTLYAHDPFNWEDAENFYFAYPRSSMDKQKFIPEHHFWFQCTAATMAGLVKMPQGIYDGGRIVLECGPVHRSIEMKINVRSKKPIPPINETKLIPTVVHGPNKDYKRQYDHMNYYPQSRNSLLIHKIFLKEKDDCDLHGDTVIIF